MARENRDGSQDFAQGFPHDVLLACRRHAGEGRIHVEIGRERIALGGGRNDVFDLAGLQTSFPDHDGQHGKHSFADFERD